MGKNPNLHNRVRWCIFLKYELTNLRLSRLFRSDVLMCVCLMPPIMAYSSTSSGNCTDSICNNCRYCRMYVACNWINPVPVNSSATLSAPVSLNAYRIAMKVVAPIGTATWLNQASNSSNISNNYTFIQTGLYTITVSARDINDSLSGSVIRCGTYQVRVY